MLERGEQREVLAQVAESEHAESLNQSSEMSSKDSWVDTLPVNQPTSGLFNDKPERIQVSLSDLPHELREFEYLPDFLEQTGMDITQLGLDSFGRPYLYDPENNEGIVITEKLAHAVNNKELEAARATALDARGRISIRPEQISAHLDGLRRLLENGEMTQEQLVKMYSPSNGERSAAEPRTGYDEVSESKVLVLELKPEIWGHPNATVASTVLSLGSLAPDCVSLTSTGEIVLTFPGETEQFLVTNSTVQNMEAAKPLLFSWSGEYSLEDYLVEIEAARDALRASPKFVSEEKVEMSEEQEQMKIQLTELINGYNELVHKGGQHIGIREARLVPKER